MEKSGAAKRRSPRAEAKRPLWKPGRQTEKVKKKKLTIFKPFRTEQSIQNAIFEFAVVPLIFF